MTARNVKVVTCVDKTAGNFHPTPQLPSVHKVNKTIVHYLLNTLQWKAKVSG